MPRLRAVRTAEEAAKVPEDQAIAVLLPGEGEEVIGSVSRGEDQREASGDKLSPPVPEGENNGQQAKEGAAKSGSTDRQEAEEGQEQESEALKKRLGEVERAERSAQAAQELAAARQREIERLSQAHSIEQVNARREVLQAHLDTVSNGLLAAQTESEAAQRDWEAAASEGDFKRQSEANVRINRAQARLLQYEDAKINLEAQARAAAEFKPQQQQSGDRTEQAMQQLPEPAKQWLRAHPEYLTDQRKNRKIVSLHDDAIDEGHKEFSPAYFEFLETKLGMRQPKQARDDDDDDSVSTRRERSIVSAPVSREAVSMKDGRSVSHRITLSPEQRSAAKIAGITEVEYAKQLIRLEKAKREGSIQ